MSANIAIGNSIQNAAASQQQAARPAAQSYHQAQVAHSATQTSAVVQSYAAPRTHDVERLRKRDVIRNVKQHLTHAASEHISEHAYHEMIAAYQQSIRNIFGDAENPATIHAEAQALLRHWREVSDLSSRRNMLGQLASFTARVNTVASELQALQHQADAALADMLRDTNQTLRHLDAMNVALSSAHMLEQPTDYMEEERDALLGVLAGYLGIKTMVDSNGAVRAFIDQDTVLLGSNKVAQFEYVASMPSYSNPEQMLGGVRIAEGSDIIRVIRDKTSGHMVPTSKLKSGALAGLQHARDVLIPTTMGEFDIVISTLRDDLEAWHHDGMHPPPMPMLLGTRPTGIHTQHHAHGMFEIGLEQRGGGASDTVSWRMELGTLDDGAGPGKFSTQTLLREINQHFTPPERRVTLGALDNVQLALLVQQLPTVPAPSMRMDLALSSMHVPVSVFLHTMQLLDDTGSPVCCLQPGTRCALAPQPYSIHEDARMLTVSLAAPVPEELRVGDWVYLPPLAQPQRLPAMQAKQLTGMFAVTRIAGKQIELLLPEPCRVTGPLDIDADGVFLETCYYHVPAHSTGLRTEHARGALHCDLGAAPASSYYDICLDMGCNDAEGIYRRGTVRYRIQNHANDLYNKRVHADSASGDAQLISHPTPEPLLRAYLADAQGNPTDDTVGHVALQACHSEGIITVRSQRTALHDGKKGESFAQSLGLYPLFSTSKILVKRQPHVGAAMQFALHPRLLDHPEQLASARGMRHAQQLDMEYVTAFYHDIWRQAQDAEDAAARAHSTLEGYMQRAEAVAHINPAEEMAAIDVYQQSCQLSARAITQVGGLFASLCNDAG
jgi:hypothetical protein